MADPVEISVQDAVLGLFNGMVVAFAVLINDLHRRKQLNAKELAFAFRFAADKCETDPEFVQPGGIVPRLLREISSACTDEPQPPSVPRWSPTIILGGKS